MSQAPKGFSAQALAAYPPEPPKPFPSTLPGFRTVYSLHLRLQHSPKASRQQKCAQNHSINYRNFEREGQPPLRGCRLGIFAANLRFSS